MTVNDEFSFIVCLVSFTKLVTLFKVMTMPCFFLRWFTGSFSMYVQVCDLFQGGFGRWMKHSLVFTAFREFLVLILLLKLAFPLVLWLDMYGWVWGSICGCSIFIWSISNLTSTLLRASQRLIVISFCCGLVWCRVVWWWYWDGIFLCSPSSNTVFSCLCLLSAGITGVCPHARCNSKYWYQVSVYQVVSCQSVRWGLFCFVLFCCLRLII